MNELEQKKQNLLNLKKELKKTERKNFLLKIGDNFSICAGIASTFCLFITPTALIPLGAFIGIDVYITKKEEQTEMQICRLRADQTKLENDIFKKNKTKQTNETDRISYNINDQMTSGSYNKTLIKTKIPK